MVGFNSDFSKTSAYQKSSTAGAASPAGQAKENTGTNKLQTQIEEAVSQAKNNVSNNSGVVYDKSSVLDQLVNQATSSALGKTVGSPQLSETASKYYDQLKGKFGDMDFVLVSKDQIASAQANAASYANPNKMVVLIDEEKLERMATDENFRKKYEGIIAMAKEGIGQMKDQFGNSSDIKGYGMQMGDDGEVSYFAVVKKANEQQAKRVEKRKAEKKEADKKAEKKASEKRAEARKEAKEAQEERLDKVLSKRRQAMLTTGRMIADMK